MTEAFIEAEQLPPVGEEPSRGLVAILTPRRQGAEPVLPSPVDGTVSYRTLAGKHITVGPGDWLASDRKGMLRSWSQARWNRTWVETAAPADAAPVSEDAVAALQSIFATISELEQYNPPVEDPDGFVYDAMQIFADDLRTAAEVLRREQAVG